MPVNKDLFMEDLKGVHGKAAQEFAYADVEKYLAFDLSVEEVAELSELEDALEEKEDEITVLEAENEKLQNKIKVLQLQNLMLKKENFAVGNLLDDIVIKKKNPFVEKSGV